MFSCGKLSASVAFAASYFLFIQKSKLVLYRLVAVKLREFTVSSYVLVIIKSSLESASLGH